MRFISCLIGISLVCTLSGKANASCGPDALGTSRTIEIDPAKFRSISGRESGLGLRHKEVILTFDDGPIAGKTSKVLKSLQEECVKATFFYVGKMAQAYPKLVRKVVHQGHTLAHHTHDHDRLPNYSISQASQLIDRGVSRLQKIAYGDASSIARTPFFRYPYLARNRHTDKLLAQKGMVAFAANIDSRDWERDSPKTVHDRIMTELGKQGRGIILMHDIHARTAKMLPDLLRSLKSRGYRVVHMVAGKKPNPGSQPTIMASLDNLPNSATYSFNSGKRHPPRVEKTLGSDGDSNVEKSAGVSSLSGKYYRRRSRSGTRGGQDSQRLTRSKWVRQSKPLLLTGAKVRGTYHMGDWRLRRSQWILR